MDAPWRHPENLSDARGIDIVDMEQFGSHVPGVDNLSFAGFRHNGLFCHVKFFSYEVKHMVGEFSNLRHNQGICVGK